MYRDGQGRGCSLPASWTNAAAADPYVVLSAGRSLLHLQDLLALVERLLALLSVRKSERAEARGGGVK